MKSRAEKATNTLKNFGVKGDPRHRWAEIPAGKTGGAIHGFAGRASCR
jgi:hypothetical protein